MPGCAGLCDVPLFLRWGNDQVNTGKHESLFRVNASQSNQTGMLSADVAVTVC